MSALLPRTLKSITRPVASSKARMVWRSPACFMASATSAREPDFSRNGPLKAVQVVIMLYIYPGNMRCQYYPGKILALARDGVQVVEEAGAAAEGKAALDRFLDVDPGPRHRVLQREALREAGGNGRRQRAAGAVHRRGSDPPCAEDVDTVDVRQHVGDGVA